jgi:hypothetical protein
MRVTKEEIDYQVMPYGHIATIPKGVKVEPAYNLPDDRLYWANDWESMSDREVAWGACEGFLIDEEQTEVIPCASTIN